MRITHIKDSSGSWERRIKIAPKRDGFSIITRLRDMDRPVKKTIYVEHVFIDSAGEVVHHHVKFPEPNASIN